MKTSNFLTLTFLILFNSCTKPQQSADEPLVPVFRSVLDSQMIHIWYPRVLDRTNGGFYSDFTYDWKKGEPQNKFIVTQARYIWAASFLYERYEQKKEYLEYADHGFRFLEDKMWDKEYGGFYDLTDSLGNVPDLPFARDKRAYGNSFAIYALAEYYKVSQNDDALTLAKQAFMWLDEHARDQQYGGYFQILDAAGNPVKKSEAETYQKSDRSMIRVKDYNSSIHLLEAFTTLYEVWPDSLVHERLQEMYDLVSGIMTDDRGFLKLYFHPDWTQVTDEELEEYATGRYHPENHITFGHDVETAFLLYEAAEALKIDVSAILPQMKKMVDHAIEKGWDRENGGLFDEGKYVDGKMEVANRRGQWWTQVEALNSFLLMDQLLPGDSMNYYQKFEKQWNYIDNYLIDYEYGGFYINGLDEDKSYRKAPKATIWKGNYHTIRAMVQCVEMLGERGK